MSEEEIPMNPVPKDSTPKHSAPKHSAPKHWAPNYEAKHFKVSPEFDEEPEEELIEAAADMPLDAVPAAQGQRDTSPSAQDDTDTTPDLLPSTQEDLNEACAAGDPLAVDATLCHPEGDGREAPTTEGSRSVRVSEQSAPVEPDPAADPLDEEPRPHAKHHRAARIVAIVLTALVVIVSVGALMISRTIQSGKEKIQTAASAAATTREEGTIDYNGKTYVPKDSVVSVAILGYDATENSESNGWSGQADTLMVAAIDLEDGSITVIAVPRNTMATVDKYVGDAYLGQVTEQICLAFSYGDGGATSSERTIDALSRVLMNIPIEYYFAINWEGIGPINDSIGGVTLTPLETFANKGIYEGQEITLLDQTAYTYLKYRSLDESHTAEGRLARQEQYLKAFATKVLSNVKGADISSLVSLYNTAAEYSITNLGLDEFSYLATVVASGGASGVEIVSLEGTWGETDESRWEEYYLDEDSVYQTVLDVYYEEAE